MDYNLSTPLQRRRNIYRCNICHIENDGYIARNNHSRIHPNVSPTYTITNQNIRDEYYLSINDSIISSVDYDGDTYMEDTPMDTGKFIPYCCYRYSV